MVARLVNFATPLPKQHGNKHKFGLNLSMTASDVHNYLCLMNVRIRTLKSCEGCMATPEDRSAQNKL